MAKSRDIKRRIKSVKNTSKITRTMELIATAKSQTCQARIKQSLPYFMALAEVAREARRAAGEQDSVHPLLVKRPVKKVAILVVTANRGLCGGYNSNVQRAALARLEELKAAAPSVSIEISGKRGISGFKGRGIAADATYTHLEDKPRFDEVAVLAEQYLNEFLTGKLDRLDVAYTRFENIARQQAVVETLLPLGSLELPTGRAPKGEAPAKPQAEVQYEFLPSAESILEEVVPTSFKVKLFKCFLDAAVSEQIARMTSMKAATDNANKIIKKLSMTYNRARQTQITGEMMEVLGGVEALKNK